MSGSSHLVVSSHVSRVSARKRADRDDETSAETKEKPCSGPPKSRNRPYDNRPRSGQSHAKRRTPHKKNAVRVVLPDEPPRLTPGAATALLRILLKAHDQLAAANSHEEAIPKTQHDHPKNVVRDT